MPQEGDQAKLHDIGDLGVCEDEDLVWGPLDRVVSQQVFKQFQSSLRLELLLEHPVEDKVEDGEHRGNFLVAILMLLAEHIVHVMEVKLEKFDFAWGFVWRDIDDRFEIEDLGEDAALTCIRASFLQTLGLVLIQFCVQEESLLCIVSGGGNAGLSLGSLLHRFC